ncbi:ABC transporter transmembrane domain-containing protein [Natranaerobius thermophilus]|uniref:ABC transporter related n=1 Tax=Natranaerobius thermophilus (strain ATCC BAA-1301 / DSM 18059 / JW/NM-WN-LF) TaxID=457570 RepID=B2A0X3_NATTJ|nr:ABC transporter ATP-binding protein [Natranaerobius thermophilus]ACB86002.1 ABC transporter related [Natranaerobius thermophilus JW/NM-WN-LF]
MKIVKLAQEHLLKYKISLFVFAMMSLITWVVSIVLPYLTGYYVDILNQGPTRQEIKYFTLIILAVGLFNIIASFVKNYLHRTIQTKSMIDLNFYVLKHLVKLPVRYFEDKDSAYLNQRINNDSKEVINFVLDNFVSIIKNFLTVTVLIYISLTINVRLTLILLPLIPLYLGLYYLFRKPLYNKNYELKEKQNKFFSVMNQFLQKTKLIKLTATFREAHNQLEQSFKTMLLTFIKYTKLSLLFSNSDSFTKVLARVVVFFFGGLEIMNGNLTIGEFTIINSYFSMIKNGVSYFLGLGSSYQKALVAYDRLMGVLYQPKETIGEVKIDNINTIQLNDVSFSFDNSNYVIETLNYKFEKGKIYCILGDNGTGKSTLINIVLGLYNDYYDGQIYYNSNELRNLDMYYVRRKIVGVSEQEPMLMNNLLINNMTFGIENYNYQDLKILLENLNFDPNKFKEGLRTNIEEGSKNISGGEKLKISLIRTLLKDPELLVLDEPTSALDFQSIEKLKELLIQTKHNRITIVITHNKDFVDVADEIIDLNVSRVNNVS